MIVVVTLQLKCTKKSFAALLLLAVDQGSQNNVGKQFHETIESWITLSIQNTD